MQAGATRQAVEIQVTQQALKAEATRTAYEMAVTATAVVSIQQAEATHQAARAELDRMAIKRNRILQPLALYGPWLVLVLFVGLAIWGAHRLAPAVEAYLLEQQVIDDTRPVILQHPLDAIETIDVDVAPGPSFHESVVNEQ